MPEIVVITQGTAGLGRHTAEHFARAGSKLAILGRDDRALADAARDLAQLGAPAVLAIPCDPDNDAQVDAATERVEVELGPIDVWIDAAAG